MSKKLGRPFSEDKKEVKITVRFTKEEHENAKKRAKDNNMNLAQYIRYLLDIENKK